MSKNPTFLFQVFLIKTRISRQRLKIIEICLKIRIPRSFLVLEPSQNGFYRSNCENDIEVCEVRDFVIFENGFIFQKFLFRQPAVQKL